MSIYEMVSGTMNSFQPHRLFFPLVYIPSLVPDSVDRLPGVRSWTDLGADLPWPLCTSAISMYVMTISLCVHRYLFALQVKQDLAQGRLTCNDTSAALLISHIVQCKFCWFPLGIMSEITQWSDRLDRKSHPLKTTIIMSLYSFTVKRMLKGGK